LLLNKTNWPESFRDDRDFHAFPKISFLKIFKGAIQGSSKAVHELEYAPQNLSSSTEKLSLLKILEKLSVVIEKLFYSLHSKYSLLIICKNINLLFTKVCHEFTL